jgi:hypothetical protein
VLSLPGYETIGVLGRGGFGVVYRARQLTVDREVAIKVDTRVILDDRDQRRFLREVRAAGRLSGHPNVVELYDAGMLPDGRPFLVMELCPAGSLAGRSPLSPPDVVTIGHGIADALVAAHGLGVLHRDIKPGNILVKRYGTVGLGDFGLAALIESGRDSSVTLAALTPAYAPPEAFHLEAPTPRSDIYALGATLYALLAGRPPRFPAGSSPSVPEIIRLHDAPVLDLPGVPTDLTAVLRRSLAKDPAYRYPDAAAFRDDLARLSGSSVPITVTPRIRRAARRPLLLAGTALAAVLILLGVWYFAVRDRSTTPPASQAAPGPASTAAVDLGIPVITDPCPATKADGQARCAERAECWSGPVLINGEVTSIRKLPCDQEHSWETFAIAPVPPDIGTPYSDVLEANARVTKVCSTDTLLASRFGKALDIAADQWEATVLPPTPDDRAAGRAVYRCLGSITEHTASGTAFRPRQ